MLTYRVAPPSWIAVASVLRRRSACGLSLARLASSTRARVQRRDRARPRSSPPSRRSGSSPIRARCVAARGDGRLHVTFLDVGQGDSAFVVFPRGSTLLVDAGGLSSSSAFDIGDRVVAPVLRDAGSPADRLSRADARRSGSHRRRRVDRPRVPAAGSVGGDSGAAVRAADALCGRAAQAAGARWANVYRGDRVAIDGVDVIARHPGRPTGSGRRSATTTRWCSSCAGATCRSCSPATSARRSSATSRPRLAPARLRVVKIPHHGSLTSSTPAFVAALHPQSRRRQRRPSEPLRPPRPGSPRPLPSRSAQQCSGPTRTAP